MFFFFFIFVGFRCVGIEAWAEGAPIEAFGRCGVGWSRQGSSPPVNKTSTPFLDRASA
jgi:hypothetical protein